MASLPFRRRQARAAVDQQNLEWQIYMIT